MGMKMRGRIIKLKCKIRRGNPNIPLFHLKMKNIKDQFLHLNKFIISMHNFVMVDGAQTKRHK